MQTLREEMRKVQSSAALLERQRNPGVGYWTSRQAPSSADVRTSISSNSSDVASRPGSPQPSASPAANDEEVNLEYLRNVIMQFLEHKEMRVRTFDPIGPYRYLFARCPAQPRESPIYHTTFHSTRNQENNCEGLVPNHSCRTDDDPPSPQIIVS